VEGAGYRVEFFPKIRPEVVILDEDLRRVTASIERAARTECIGGGKVLIYDVENAVRVRTGEYGFNAI